MSAGNSSSGMAQETSLWSKILLLLTGGVIGGLFSLAIFIIWQEGLQKRFGAYKALFILILIVLLVFLAVYFVKKVVIDPMKARYLALAKTEARVMLNIETLLESHDNALILRVEESVKKLIRLEEEDNLKRLREKYSQVHFKALSPTNEFTKSETNAVKIGLVNGVQHSIHAITRIEKDSSDLPLDTQDKINYFEANKEALMRIRANHPLISDLDQYVIHRIFVISEERIKNTEAARKIESIIEQHCREGFYVKLVLQERLTEPQGYTFAIYDNEIVLRLFPKREQDKISDEGVLYFHEAVVNDIYKQRYRQIEAQSSSAEQFWRQHFPSSPERD